MTRRSLFRVLAGVLAGSCVALRTPTIRYAGFRLPTKKPYLYIDKHGKVVGSGPDHFAGPTGELHTFSYTWDGNLRNKPRIYRLTEIRAGLFVYREVA